MGAPKLVSQSGAGIWVPFFILSHIWALVFICKALAVLNPVLWRRIRSKYLFWVPGFGASDAAAPAPRPVVRGDLWKTHLMVSRVAEPLQMVWQSVGCQYNTPQGIKTVLEDVSGVANPYELLALMGPSGAGKSTLLDILAARKTVGRLTGTITVNGEPRRHDFVQNISYVPQEDNFMPAMTVSETCELYASLTLPPGTPGEQAATRIDDVLCSMGMLHARDTLVGGVLPGGLLLRGLSGGERRRLSVAVGILASPSIVFLDEPTSGLDSCSALAVVEHLRDRARESGIAVVASIHQPRSAVWACFDACAVLSGGFGMYQGRCADLVDWFQGTLGYGPWDSSVHGTASDWVMDLINVGFTKGELHGFTIATRGDLEQAARKFSQHFRRIKSSLIIRPKFGRDGKQQQQLLTKEVAGAVVVEQQQQQQPEQQQPQQQQLKRRSRASGSGSGGGVVGEQGEQPSLWSALRPFQTSAALKRSGGGSAHSSGAGAEEASSTAVASHRITQQRRGGQQQHQQQQHQQQQQPSRSRPLLVIEAVGGSSTSSSSPVECCGLEVDGADDALDERRPGWWKQFKTLLRRELLVTMRNPADVAGRMLLFCYVGAFCGLVFWRLGGSLDAARNRINLLFCAIQLFMLLPYVYMSLYAADRRHFTADMAARLYTPGPYYMAKTIGVLPFAAANVLFCCMIMYGMAGLRLNAVSVFVHASTCVLTYLVAQQIQALAAIVMKNEDGAFVMTIGWTAVNIFLSNFVIRFQDMANGWLRAFSWISAANFGFGAVMRAEFAGGYLSCADGIAPDFVTTLQALLPATPALRTNAVVGLARRPGKACVVALDAVLEYFDINMTPVFYTGALVVYLAVMHFITYTALVMLARKERR